MKSQSLTSLYTFTHKNELNKYLVNFVVHRNINDNTRYSKKNITHHQVLQLLIKHTKKPINVENKIQKVTVRLKKTNNFA